MSIRQSNLPNLNQPKEIIAGSRQVNWERVLRIAIVLGLFPSVMVIAILQTKFNPLYGLIVSFLPFIVVGVEILLRRFNLAILLLLITAAFTPISLPTGTGSRLVDSLIVTIMLLAFWVIRMVAIDRKISIQPFPSNLPLILFCVVILISLGWSVIFRDPFVKTWESFPFVQIASTLVMLALPAAFLYVANHVKEARILNYMVILMGIAGVIGLFEHFSGLNLQIDSLGLFSMWVVGLTLAAVLFERRIPPFWRLVLALIPIGWFYWGMILNITWLAGWMPNAMVLLIMVFMRSKRLLALMGVFFVIFAIIKIDYFISAVEDEKQESGSTRLAAWQMNWLITKDHLLFGTGPAGYAAYYMSYFPSQAMATHSNYIDIVAQTGVVGFILNAWFFISLAWYGFKLSLRLKGRGDMLEGLANASFAGTVGCIVMMAFGDWLYPFAYTQTISGFDYAVYNWIFMAFIPVIDRLTQPTAGSAELTHAA